MVATLSLGPEMVIYDFTLYVVVCKHRQYNLFVSVAVVGIKRPFKTEELHVGVTEGHKQHAQYVH